MIGSKQCYQSSPHGNKGCIVTWGGKQQNPGSALWVLRTCWTCRCSAWLCVFSTSGLDPVSLCLDNTNFVLPHCDDDGSALFSDPGDLHGGWQHSICSSRIRSSPRTLDLQWLMTTVMTHTDYTDLLLITELLTTVLGASCCLVVGSWHFERGLISTCNVVKSAAHNLRDPHYEAHFWHHVAIVSSTPREQPYHHPVEQKYDVWCGNLYVQEINKVGWWCQLHANTK